MKRSVILAGSAVIVMAAGTGLTAAVAAGASHHHTMTFTGHRLKTKSIGKSHEIEADTLTKAGKTIGYATESCDFGATNDVCDTTFTFEHGVLYGHVTFPITASGTAPSTATGKITGGLGAYSKDKGTIKVVTSASGGKYTLKYTS